MNAISIHSFSRTKIERHKISQNGTMICLVSVGKKFD